MRAVGASLLSNGESPNQESLGLAQGVSTQTFRSTDFCIYFPLQKFLCLSVGLDSK